MRGIPDISERGSFHEEFRLRLECKGGQRILGVSQGESSVKSSLL